MPPAIISSSAHRPRVSDAHKRRLDVFVEIPPSPILSARMTPSSRQDTSRPEPTTATPKQLTSSKAINGSLKRKLDLFVEIPPSPLHRTTPKTCSFPNRKNRAYVCIPPSPLVASRMKGTLNSGIRVTPLSTKALNLNKSTESPYKKPKLTDLMKSHRKMSNETLENDPYPNGWFNCHQCRNKHDISLGVQCTIFFRSRCKLTYCKACLRKRYGLEADSIMLREAIPDARHASGVSYHWTCPKCADSCNCNRCRKSKGLPALGRIPVPQQPAKLSTPVRPGVKGVLQASFPFPGSASSKVARNPQQELSKSRPPRTKKPVSEPKWISVPTKLSRSEIEDRFFMREFILRFEPLMKIGVTFLEELDLFDKFSTQCARALINSLLDLLAADAEPEEAKVIRETLKRIGATGRNPAVLWAHLKRLCNNLPSDFFVAPIPHPVPRPSYAEEESSSDDEEPAPPRASQRIKTRRSASKTLAEKEDPLELGDGVTHALQLIPCIVALCECALQGPSVRAEIEEGTEEARTENREYFANVRNENERWTKEKSELGLSDGKEEEEEKSEMKVGKSKEEGLEKYKAYRKALSVHKEKLAALENAHRLRLQSAAPRFGPLGRDSQGRVYYAATAYRRKDKRTRARIPDEEDRVGLRKWGWFLAVWGRGSIASSSSMDDGDGKEERWWGYAEPAEIRQLAKWLAAAEGIDGKDSFIEGPGGLRMKGEDLKRFGAEPNPEAESALGQGPPTPAQVKALVKNLNEYADLLEWRIGEAQN